MQLECWSIQGTSFHFGQHGLGQEETTSTMPSDSLFAALVARLARTRGSSAVEEFCQPFLDGKPPFVLSSTYPLAGNVRFFPVPLWGQRAVDVTSAQAKTIKKIRFVSESIFRQIIKGVSLAKIHGEARALQGGQVLVTEDEYKRLPAALQRRDSPLWRIQQNPHVTLDRSSSASNLYHVGKVHFAAECGLWFGARWFENNPSLKKLFKELLTDLADAGFGAERGVGLGAAQVKALDLLELPDAQTAWVTLSRYLPTADETGLLADEGTAYALKSVGGWLDSPVNLGQRRRPVNLLVEGSVIGAKTEKQTPGQMVDVRPKYKDGEGNELDPLGHAVYRCGFALAIGLEGGAS